MKRNQATESASATTKAHGFDQNCPQTFPRFSATHPPPDAGFIDERELLKRVPVSRRTAYAWQKSGKLPVIRIGGRKLFYWPSVSAALLRQQRGGGE